MLSESEVWSFNVSCKQVLTQWFSYCKKDRERQLGERVMNSYDPLNPDQSKVLPRTHVRVRQLS